MTTDDLQSRPDDIPRRTSDIIPDSDYTTDEFEDEPLKTPKLVAPCIHEIIPINVTKLRGEKLNIQASYTSEEKPVIKWYREDEEIHNG